jgi:ketosteroid isomerase-like protein
LAAGDPEPAVSAFAPDGRFVFPGDHAFAADCHGRDAIGAWFRRFARLRPRFEVVDVVAAGPPWNMRVTIRFRDRIGDDYQNEGVQFVRMRWGRIVLDRVYIDTQAVATWVAEHPEESAA